MNHPILPCLAVLIGVAVGDAVAAPQGPIAPPASFPHEFRRIDGSDNHLQQPLIGAADMPFLRLVANDYADGIGSPSGPNRPSARLISNVVVDQPALLPNAADASDYVWLWGQFLDHDITETPIAVPFEPFDIAVPTGDPWFDPNSTGTVVIPLNRSGYDMVGGVREQLNLITAWIDASNVYGSDMARALELRTLDGTGKLKTSAGGFLPYNVNGFPNAPDTSPSYFLAGDVRANEQVALTAIHTLFVREHNWWAERLAARGMSDGDRIYAVARAIVGAEMQAITYNEFLPALLGPGALLPYAGYRPAVDATIANEFAAGAYRFGHTMLSPRLKRTLGNGMPHPSGHLSLANAFFNPPELVAVGLEPYLRGLVRQRAQEVDPYLVDEVRNFLFGPPGAGGFDLAALNIQRGRDHGIPGFNDLCQGMGRPRAVNWADISSDPVIQARLAAAYATVDDVDAWTGMLSQDHLPGALVGVTIHAVVVDQFTRLRDGDRFWYQGYLPPSLVDLVERQTLARIIRRNTDVGGELPDDVFRYH